MVFFSLYSLFCEEIDNIKIKISAPKQKPELKVKFNREDLGIAGKTVINVLVTGEPGFSVDNIEVIEKWDNGEIRKINPGNFVLLSYGSVFLWRISFIAKRSGLVDFLVSVSGKDNENFEFKRVIRRQIFVSETIDSSFSNALNIGPFRYMSTELEGYILIEDVIKSFDLKDVFEIFDRIEYPYRIFVEGFCDKSSKTNLNLVLSSNRAFVVAKKISKIYNIDFKRIYVKGRGSEEEPYDDPPATKKLNRNRRVTVKIK